MVWLCGLDSMLHEDARRGGSSRARAARGEAQRLTSGSTGRAVSWPFIFDVPGAPVIPSVRCCDAGDNLNCSDIEYAARAVESIER